MRNLRLCVCMLLISFSKINAQSADSIHLKDTIQLQREKFKIKKLYVPVALTGLGIALNSNKPESFKNEIAEERNEHLFRFGTSVDNYLQYSPIAIAYGLDALGFKSKTDLVNRSAILIKGELLNLITVSIVKKYAHQLRPDGSNYKSFPSGHTANAFAAATFLSEEYKHRFKWMPYAAYGIAGTVGVLRMANNRHYISDVLTGAGMGFLSMKLSYWTHQYKWGKRKH